MAVDASGGLLATASADRRVLVWDVDGGFCTHAFKGHTAVVNCVQFHPDIHRLLVNHLFLLVLLLLPNSAVDRIVPSSVGNYKSVETS